MRKFLFLLGAAGFLMSCNNAASETKPAGDSTTAQTAMPLPYTPSYSSSFKMGNPDYCTMVVQGSWKDWEMNTMDNMKSWVADTITVFHSDNTMVKGVDSLAARWKRGRAKYSAVATTIDAVMPVYSTDKNENWVLVWATEIDTKLDGKKDTSSVMETWRINKDNKADLLLQFDRANRKL
jgi:hypothetical protein